MLFRSRDPKEAEKYRMREDAINERRNFFLETLDKGLKEGRKEGREEGRKEGREEGRKEEQIKIARSLLDILDIETISIKTGLSIDEVKELN